METFRNGDVSNVKNMDFMFSNSKFNGDISGWDTGSVESMIRVFVDSPLEGNRR